MYVHRQRRLVLPVWDQRTFGHTRGVIYLSSFASLMKVALSAGISLCVCSPSSPVFLPTPVFQPFNNQNFFPLWYFVSWYLGVELGSWRLKIIQCNVSPGSDYYNVQRNEGCFMPVLHILGLDTKIITFTPENTCTCSCKIFGQIIYFTVDLHETASYFNNQLKHD